MNNLVFHGSALTLLLNPFVSDLIEAQSIPKKPNILICVADDASMHFGAYGCKWTKTPAFDRVAKEGILFTNAYTPNAKCAPSRAIMLTGRNSWQLEEAANHFCFFPQKFKTYAEALLENGYYVGYTAKGWAPGDPGEINGKERELLGTAFQKQKTIPPAKGISAIDYAENFKIFMEGKPKDKSFCFWYGSNEPHRPYEFMAGAKKGGKKISDIDKVYSFWPNCDTVRNDMLDYAFELEYFDSHLQKMLRILEQSGELDNTLIIVTSDNGIPFPRVKGQEYEISNHMPLAIMWKKGITKPGRKVDDFISFIDFAPTILQVAGINEKQSGLQPIQGQSLVPIFQSKKSGVIEKNRDFVLLGQERHDPGRPNDWGYPIRSIIMDGYLYIYNFETDRWPACNPETGYLNCDGGPTKTICIHARRDSTNFKYWQWSFGKRTQEELYLLSNDNECMNNLASLPIYQKIKSKLHDRLFDELKKQGDPRMFGNGHIFDEYLISDPKIRNFYEKYTKGEKVKAGWVNSTDFDLP